MSDEQTQTAAREPTPPMAAGDRSNLMTIPGPAEGVSQAAAEAPDRPAIDSPNGDRTFGELDARINRLARALRDRGVAAGGSMAIVCANRPEFAEAFYAGLRAGLRVTPINWHFTAEEIAYVVDDCEATVFVADARFTDACAEAARQSPEAIFRVSIAGDVDGFEPLEDVIAPFGGEPLPDPGRGTQMLYTSGTTGRPKGVHRTGVVPRQVASEGPTAFRPGQDRSLCTGPLYHAAPLLANLNIPMAVGVGTVLMDGWDAEETLRLIERHRITHTHMVATMFHRLLALPEDVRGRYDLSSLRYVVHGAAPTPVWVKQQIMDWFGPIVHEYYAATEGAGTAVGPHEWLEHPGTVGRVQPPDHVQVRDEDGNLLGAGEVGVIYLRAPQREEFRFTYYKDPDKTGGAYDGDYFTLKDVGYVDEQGYLFLTDRSADLIISGGVNIYPAEVDAALLEHPAVADVCTVGVPNEEWGEEVKAVVELEDGREPSDALAEELIAFCRDRLARFKCPRSVAFEDLPRHETGKLYRRLVRDKHRGEVGA